MAPTHHQPTKNPRRGQAAIMITLSLVPTIGLLGLVTDIGYSYYRKELAKTAAISAAVAAAQAAQGRGTVCNASGLTCQDATACAASPSLNASDNMTNGCLYAQKNGFVNSGSQTVTLEAHLSSTNAPPVTGVTPVYWIAATVSETNGTLFSRVLGMPSTKVVARSTTGIFDTAAAACIYALAPTGQGVKVNGATNVVSTCGVFVDSNSTASPYAVVVGGGGSITAATVQIVGNWNTNGGGSISPTPKTGVAALSDPLANVPAPVFHSGCDDSLGLQNVPSSQIASTMSANGGTFVECGGFSMNGNANITLPAGTYVMNGGSIDLKNGNLNGTGVTFYLTGGLSAVSINGTLDGTLQAPTSGDMHGMLFFQDRTIAPETMNLTINGGAGLILDGTIYFPNQDLNYSGGSATTNNYTAIVAYTITFIGNSYFSGDKGGLYTGFGAPALAILE